MTSTQNLGHSFTGKVDDYVKGKGWFFGSFMDETSLNSDLVEVAWQKMPNLKSDPAQAHYHKSTIEINIIIKGKIHLTIDDHKYSLVKGEFYIIWPNTVVSDLSTDKDTELIVIRAPSLNDKVLTQ